MRTTRSKVGKEIEMVMKQGNLTCDDGVNWRVWRLNASNRWAKENGQIDV
jgi:hypothetical protein